MRLIIAEKPSVAKDIANVLTNGNYIKKGAFFECGEDKVTWCFGHLLKTVEPEVYNPSYKRWNTDDLPLKLYPLQYEPIADKKEHTESVISLIKQASSIVNAGDADDEGQLLVDELLIYAGNTKPVKRLYMKDNTDKGIAVALSNMKDNSEYKGDYLRAYMRASADLIYGLSMTRAYTNAAQANGYTGVLSVGRVQTPTLGLVVRRWLANQSHVDAFYFNLNGEFDFGNGKLTARLKLPEDAPVDEKGRVILKGWMEEKGQACKGVQAKVISCTVKAKEVQVPVPFNLSRLQQQMNKDHGISVAKTLEITQVLREKYKAITYNRSDCTYLSDEQFNEAPAIVAVLQEKCSEFTDVKVDLTIKSKSFNSSKITAHTAIIPTDNPPNMADMTEQERTVYRAIVRQYLVQFMQPKCFDEATGTIDVGGNTFEYKAQKETDKGFEAFLKEAKEVDESEGEDSPFDVVSQLVNGQNGMCEAVSVEQKKTSPPQLFTQASLVSAMTRIADYVEDPNIKKLLKEKDKDNDQVHGSIGTEATRASIIETLITRRRYIDEVKGKLVPTETGLAFFNALPDKASLPDMTALWFEQQTRIANGELESDQFIEDLMDFIKGEVQNVTVGDIKGDGTSEKDDGKNPRLEAKCPNCNNEIIASPKVFACSGCNFKIWKTIAQKNLTNGQVETLLKKGKTTEIKGFKSKADKTFSAFIVLKDKVTGQVEFEFPPRKK